MSFFVCFRQVCYLCMIIYQRHMDVLQYKEGEYCRASGRRVAVHSLLYLTRGPHIGISNRGPTPQGDPARCPIQGRSALT